MSTRSSIGIKYKDGTIKDIYCHYDGYLEYNGQMLYYYYIIIIAILEDILFHMLIKVILFHLHVDLMFIL